VAYSERRRGGGFLELSGDDVPDRIEPAYPPGPQVSSPPPRAQVSIVVDAMDAVHAPHPRPAPPVPPWPPSEQPAARCPVGRRGLSEEALRRRVPQPAAGVPGCGLQTPHPSSAITPCRYSSDSTRSA
jgi:hypothetical protein